MELGKLKEIDIRKVWAHKQYDFSDWLAKIEKKVGHPLIWKKSEDKKAAYAYSVIEGLDFNNPDNYEYLINKSIEEVLRFKKAFQPFIK